MLPVSRGLGDWDFWAARKSFGGNISHFFLFGVISGSRVYEPHHYVKTIQLTILRVRA